VAQEENAPNKPVHLMYLVGTVILFYLLQWSIDWVWGFFTVATPSDFKITLLAAIIAAVAGIVAYKNDRLYHLANEVASELKKVTWPTAKEVRGATVVVIVMSLISALVLFGFDLMWSSLTDLIYG
jgi:preprotein translocase subunit SecE